MDLVEEAILYATVMHQGKVRKRKNIPVILHSLEVAQILGIPLAATIVPWVAAKRIAQAAGEDLGPERVVAAPSSVALALTDTPCEGEALVLMPRFVRMPWDSVL